MTIFGDDGWSNWILRSAADFLRAKADVELILSILESLSLAINYKTTAILMILEGREPAKTLRDHTILKAGQQRLLLTVSGREWCACVQTSTHYSLAPVGAYEVCRSTTTSGPKTLAQTSKPLS